MNICAGVVFYYPSIHFCDYISNYIDKINFIIVYDNSPLNLHVEHKRCLDERFGKKVIWIDTDGSNHGISVAWNTIFNEAISRGCDFCITFDQDSYLESSMVKLMRMGIENNSEQAITAMYAPNFNKIDAHSAELVEVKEAITSGAFVNLNYVKINGGYNEAYYIYVCDYEFCWKARSKGWKIFVNPAVQLCHQMDDGSTSQKSVKSKYACYYGIRNNLRLTKDWRKTFPEEAKIRRKKGLNLWLRIALKPKVGGVKKLVRIVYVLRAFGDYLIGKQGPIS